MHVCVCECGWRCWHRLHAGVWGWQMGPHPPALWTKRSVWEDGRVSGTYLPEPVRRWRRRQQQSWYAAGPLLDRNATVGRGLCTLGRSICGRCSIAGPRELQGLPAAAHRHRRTDWWIRAEAKEVQPCGFLGSVFKSSAIHWPVTQQLNETIKKKKNNKS